MFLLVLLKEAGCTREGVRKGQYCMNGLAGVCGGRINSREDKGVDLMAFVE